MRILLKDPEYREETWEDAGPWTPAGEACPDALALRSGSIRAPVSTKGWLDASLEAALVREALLARDDVHVELGSDTRAVGITEEMRCRWGLERRYVPPGCRAAPQDARPSVLFPLPAPAP